MVLALALALAFALSILLDFFYLFWSLFSLLPIFKAFELHHIFSMLISKFLGSAAHVVSPFNLKIMLPHFKIILEILIINMFLQSYRLIKLVKLTSLLIWASISTSCRLRLILKLNSVLLITDHVGLFHGHLCKYIFSGNLSYEFHLKINFDLKWLLDFRISINS